MKCELQPSLLLEQLLVSLPLLLPEMVILVELVLVSMPDPPVDQPDPLTRSVPNPQLDQTELPPLSVLEQLPVLDPLLKVAPMCEMMSTTQLYSCRHVLGLQAQSFIGQ